MGGGDQFQCLVNLHQRGIYLALVVILLFDFCGKITFLSQFNYLAVQLLECAASAVPAASASFTFVKVLVAEALCPARFRFPRFSAISGSVNPRPTALYLGNRLVSGSKDHVKDSQPFQVQ